MTGRKNGPWSKRLTAEIDERLLAREFWQEPLDQFARATHLAVALVNSRGTLIGEFFNPRPLWDVLVSGSNTERGCPFSLFMDRICTCLADAFDCQKPPLVRDQAGFIHFTIPLKLGGQRLGGIMAGQVFDKHPETLPLDRVAKHLNVPQFRVWQLAQAEVPIRHPTLRAYADLLASLSNAWLHAGLKNFIAAERLARSKRQIKRTELALTSTQEQLQGLAGNLLKVLDEQRRRIALDLHDDFAQRLAALTFDIQIAHNAIPPELNAVYEPLGRVKLAADSLSDDMRRIAHELHPSMLEDLGLRTALKAFAEDFAKTYSIPVNCRLGELPASIPVEISVCLFRITQEAFHNVIKHAGRVPITVVLSRSESGLRLAVSDKGKGFDTGAPHHGLGLISMQERIHLLGGKLRVSSNPGSGTVVAVQVPLGAMNAGNANKKVGEVGMAVDHQNLLGK